MSLSVMGEATLGGMLDLVCLRWMRLQGDTQVKKSDTGRKSCFGMLLIAIVLSSSGCSLFRATGDTIEAVGEGTGTALVGLASGTGHAIAGTGRAISRAAGSTSQAISDFSSSSDEDSQLVF